MHKRIMLRQIIKTVGLFKKIIYIYSFPLFDSDFFILYLCVEMQKILLGETV